MKNKKIVILLLLFLLPVSGCVFPGFNPSDSKTPPQTGVLIEDFSPDFQNVRSGEEVKFLLKVKNAGSVKAENGFAELLGIDQVWLNAQKTDISKTGEVFPDEEYCRYNANKKITLLPEDLEAGTTGGGTTCTWKYVAPPVSAGLSIHSKPMARFYYSYNTSTVKTITIASREELKSFEEQGKPLPSESYSKTKSPISIDVETSTPIRTYTNKVEFPIVITIKNVGGGAVCMGNSVDCKKPGGTEKNDNWNKFNLIINLPTGLSLSEGSCTSKEMIVLVGNDPQMISCRITAVISQQIGVAQKNIEVTAGYGYFIDKTTDVYVYPSSEPVPASG
jgi:hypothetical protein